MLCYDHLDNDIQCRGDHCFLAVLCIDCNLVMALLDLWPQQASSEAVLEVPFLAQQEPQVRQVSVF